MLGLQPRLEAWVVLLVALAKAKAQKSVYNRAKKKHQYLQLALAL